jgi:nicotinamide-nucleotide amidase
MSFSVSILATGSELLDGRVLDTNSNFVAKELAQLGLKLKRILVVDDDMPELLDGLRSLSAVSELVITSGGLGPTSDDLTRDLIARFFKVGLTEFPEARSHLENFYRARGRALDPSNLKQAILPVGSTMIHNERGTAPGFLMTGPGGGTHQVTTCSLSGVPREFTNMFIQSVLPLIKSRAGATTVIKRSSFRTFGLPESIVGRRIEECALPSTISVSYRAAFPEVHVVLKAPEGIDLEGPSQQVRAALNRGAIYAERPDQTLIETVHTALRASSATVATAESCTGGLMAYQLTELPGSSDVFMGSVVAYDNRIKHGVLHVSQDTLSQHGAVSAAAVREMAQSVRSLMGTTYGVAISGIAGPGGGSTEKPVGTVYVGLSGPKRSFEVGFTFVSDRKMVRTYAAHAALDLLRRELNGLEIPDTYPLSGGTLAPKA